MGKYFKFFFFSNLNKENKIISNKTFDDIKPQVIFLISPPFVSIFIVIK